MTQFKGEYPPNQEEINRQVKEENGWKCERCGHPHDPIHGYTLTVHHLDGDKSNWARWNLSALCQRCHLHIQGKVFLPQFYMLPHSEWMIPHVKGYYESKGIKWEVPNETKIQEGETAFQDNGQRGRGKAESPEETIQGAGRCSGVNQRGSMPPVPETHIG